MNNDYLFSDLRNEAKRLLRYRFLLIFALLMNCLLVARVPWAQIRPAAATSPAVNEPSGNHSPQRVSGLQKGLTEIRENRESDFQTAPNSFRDDLVPRWPIHGFDMDLDAHYQAFRRKSLKSLGDAGSWLENQFLAAVTVETENRPPKTASMRPQVHFPSFPTESTRDPKPTLSPADGMSVTELIFTNPLENSGAVNFLVDGRSISLLPGETHAFSGTLPRLVQFHRGDTFGDKETTVSTGNFQFRVTPRGWALIRLSQSQ